MKPVKQNYKSVFCDSFSALEWAEKKGLLGNSQIYSCAPTLIEESRFPVKNIEKYWVPEKIENFKSDIKSLTLVLYRICIDECNLNHDEALLVVHLFVNGFHDFYKIVGFLSHSPCFPLLCLTIKSNNSKDAYLNPSWVNLLEKVYDIDFAEAETQLPEFNGLSTEGVSLFKRMKIAGFETIRYRLHHWANKRRAQDSKKKIYGLIYSENELLIETASCLISKGYDLRFLKTTKHKQTIELADYKIGNKKFKIIQKFLKEFLERWTSDVLSNLIVDALISEMQAKLLDYHLWVHAYIDDVEIDNTDFILSGSLSSVQGRALSYVSKLKNTPIFTFHHGITHEISSYSNIQIARYDSALSDLTFVHTEMAKDELMKSPFCRAEILPVGLPLRYLRTSSTGISYKSKKPMLYISTNLRFGNTGAPIHCMENEFTREKREKFFVEKILSKVPHDIDFKAYPEERRRFTENTLASRTLSHIPNIKLVGSNIDARYILANYEILISGGATSTLGWLLSAKKPLVYIHWPAHLPLTDDSKKYFASGTLFFDASDSNFEKSLVNFLSQDINEIKRVWYSKKDHTDELVSKYIKPFSISAGIKAAGHIDKFINKC